jgi:hypothetical protein
MPPRHRGPAWGEGEVERGRVVVDILYVVLGVLLVVYGAVNKALESAAAFVGGWGVLVALIFGFVALAETDHLRKRVAELTEKMEELEEKVADEEEEGDW